MQALNSVLSLPFPPYMTMAIFAVALLCSALAFLFSKKRVNKALIWVTSFAAIGFAFVGGHFLPYSVAAKIAGMQATLDSVAFGFLLLMPIFTVLSMIKPTNNGGGGVPPMG